MSCAGKPYRPSNGTEGEIFQEDFCAKCPRDAKFREDPEKHEGCEILARTMAYNVTDPEYPKEWIYDEKGEPTCTAFNTFAMTEADKKYLAWKAERHQKPSPSPSEEPEGPPQPGARP